MPNPKAQYQVKNVKANPTKVKFKLKKNQIIDLDMATKEQQQRDEEIRRLAKDICLEFLNSNILDVEKSKHIPFKIGSAGLVIKLTNATGHKEETFDYYYNKIDKDLDDKLEDFSFDLNDSFYVFSVDFDLRPGKRRF